MTVYVLATQRKLLFLIVDIDFCCDVVLGNNKVKVLNSFLADCELII